MKITFAVVAVLFLTFQQVKTSNILLAIPFSTKSMHLLFCCLGLELSNAGHYVTILTSYPSTIQHSNLTFIHVKDGTKDLNEMNLFALRNEPTAFAVYSDMVKASAHVTWEDVNVLQVYKNRHNFDVIMTSRFMNEIALPFLNKYKGIYMMFSTPGVEYFAMSFAGNWLSPAVVPHLEQSYDEYMTFWERVNNVATFVAHRVFELYTLEPEIMETIQSFTPGIEGGSLQSLYKSSSLMLINGHFTMDGPVPLLPNQVEIGTINVHEAKPLPPDLEAFMEGSGKAGVIFFSLGSFVRGTDLPSKYTNILLEAFSRIPQRIIWKYEATDLKLPANVIVRKWLPQHDILGHHKTKLFISHCGKIGIQEAMYYGVPVLGLPIFFDQPRNAATMIRKGYALSLEWEEITPDLIVQTIDTLINDTSYSSRLRALSIRLKDQKETPAQRAVWWIDYVIRHKGAPHLNYAGSNLHFLQYILLDVLLFYVSVAALAIALLLAACWSLYRLCCSKSRSSSKSGGHSKNKRKKE